MSDLRPATAADVPEIGRIFAEGWADGHAAFAPPELMAHRRPDSFLARVSGRVEDTWVAVVDGAVVGFVMLDGDELEQVYVDRPHRGTGVAALLLAEGARLVRVAGHPTPWLAAATQNARARRFYAREGWRDLGEFSYPAAIRGSTLAVPCHRYECPPE